MGDDEALTENSGNEGGEEKRDLNKIKESESSELTEYGLEVRGKVIGTI